MSNFFFNEYLTFELTKDEITSLYRPIRKQLTVTYVLLALLFTTVTIVTLLLELMILAGVAAGMVCLSSILYFIMLRKTKKEMQQQLDLVGIKCYHFALYRNKLIVVIKDDVSIFNEYVVPRDKAKGKIRGDIITFQYDNRIYAIPTRVLRDNSKFYSIAE